MNLANFATGENPPVLIKSVMIKSEYLSQIIIERLQMIDKIDKILNNFEQEKAKALLDKNLSQAGRDNKIQKLQDDKLQALRPLVIELRTAAVKISLEAKGLALARTAAQELASEKLDYSRLQYEATAVKSALVMAGDDPFAVAEKVQNAVKSNDNYKVRAWLDILPASLPEKSKHDPSIWKSEVLDRLSNGAAKIQNAEVAELESKKQVKLQELQDIRTATNAVAKEFGSGQAIQQRILEGIHNQDGELKLDFKRGLNESHEDVIKRLEAKRAEKEKLQGQVFESFNSVYDPMLDGV